METKKENYNGWTNYETWNVKLWIDNDQASQEFWNEQARGILEGADADKYFTKEENAVNALREELKDAFEEQAEEMLRSANASASWMADLMHASLSEVNWQEIAHSIIEDLNS